MNCGVGFVESVELGGESAEVVVRRTLQVRVDAEDIGLFRVLLGLSKIGDVHLFNQCADLVRLGQRNRSGFDQVGVEFGERRIIKFAGLAVTDRVGQLVRIEKPGHGLHMPTLGLGDIGENGNIPFLAEGDIDVVGQLLFLPESDEPLGLGVGQRCPVT